MKTEINEENKARFFALYQMQEVAMIHEEVNHIDKVGVYPNDTVEYLYLRSIDQLTDEELINICQAGYKLAFMGNNCPSKWKVSKSKYNFASVSYKYSAFSFEIDLHNLSIDIYEGEELSSSFDHYSCLDHVRYIGILVPWMGLSCEEIIAAGWVKIKV